VDRNAIVFPVIVVWAVAGKETPAAASQKRQHFRSDDFIRLSPSVHKLRANNEPQPIKHPRRLPPFYLARKIRHSFYAKNNVEIAYRLCIWTW
jgi:hypothetical protein